MGGMFGRSDSIGAPVGEARAASTAGGGTALSATAAYAYLPDRTARVALIPRNFSTAVVARFGWCPYLRFLKTADLLATVTDYSVNAQDGLGTDVTLSSFPAAADGGYLLVGSHIPFRGVRIDVDATHAGAASVLTVEYWNGSAWVDITATDGTTSGGKTFAQDGNVTWTVPSAWVRRSFRDINTPAMAEAVAILAAMNTPLYWTRWSVSAALDSSVTLDGALALPASTAYAEIPSGMSFEARVVKGPGGVAGVEAVTDAGTANLIVNVFSAPDTAF